MPPETAPFGFTVVYAESYHIEADGVPMRSHKQDLMAQAVRHQQAGETAQAEALFQRLVREDPFHAEAWNLLAILTYQTGRGEAALDYFGRACAAGPTNAGYRSNRGAVLQGLGRLGEAETAYREALRLNPAHGEAANNLGNVLREPRTSEGIRDRLPPRWR